MPVSYQVVSAASLTSGSAASGLPPARAMHMPYVLHYGTPKHVYYNIVPMIMPMHACNTMTMRAHMNT